MKKILQVCAFGAPRPGNFIKALLQLQSKMEDNGYETIYAFADTAKDKDWCKDIQKNNIVYFLPVAKARILPSTYIKIRRIIKENKIDIIHSHFELYDIPIALMTPKKIKQFWHLHDAIKENYYKTKITRKLLYKIQYGYLGKNSTLLTVSKLHGEFAIELGFDAAKVFDIPNGIGFDRIKSDYNSNKKNSFLMFGWEIHRKGVDLVLEAEKQIDKNKEFSISIIGHDECKEYIKTNTTSNRIIFDTPKEDVNELYSKAKVFLHTSRAEGLSYALLEAIYAGMYVICSDIPENMFAKEFDGVYFFENQNVEQLVDAIQNTIVEGCIKEKCIKHNRDIIERKYSLESWCDEIKRIYMEKE